MPVETLGDGPNEPDPKGLPEGLHTFLTTTENHTPDRIPENTSENASGDPVMQFIQRRFQKTQAEILGIRQRSDESLRDYLQRFEKETLHMTDRSDGMMTGAFISGLRPGRFFKDLIARPPASMEDLFTQAHNFIRADEANTENRLRDSRWVPNDNKSGQGYKDTSRIHKDKLSIVQS
ncbi:retrotransposon gag domain-containing protein [Tanacetum coccineum]